MPHTKHAPLRIAHRGMPRSIRENTLGSFALALESGADGIELDVHATKDDVVVVHHDAALSHHGVAISSLTRAQLLAQTTVSDYIPTLREVCDLVNGRAELFIEIKGSGIERQVAAALEGYQGRVAIHSFDHAMIQRLSSSGNTFRLGVLVEGHAATPQTIMRATGALDLWPHHSLVDKTLVDDAHGIGGRVIPWTVNDPMTARRLASLGVDGICTDDVTMLPAS